MHRSLTCLLASVASTSFGLSWATIAAADPPRLKGDYAFTGTIDCLFAPGTGPATPGMPRANAGFNANLTPVDGGSFFSLGSNEGIYSFDGHGNGTAKWTTVSINPPPSSNAGSSANSLAFTYTATAAGRPTWSQARSPSRS